jgi:hypothetical protein
MLAATGRAGAEEPESVRVRGSHAGGFSSKATEGEGPRDTTDVASLFDGTPGVHVRRLGADDGFSTLSIRGSSSQQVSVYLSGIPLSGGATPTLDLASLPLWPRASVRVYRSFAPAALGPGSLGGTLLLGPPSVTESPRTDVYGAVGSLAMGRLRIGEIREARGVRTLTAFSASRATDSFEYLDPIASAGGKEVYRERDNASHASYSAMYQRSYPVRFTRDLVGRFTFTTLTQTRKQQLPGTIQVPTSRQELHTSRSIGGIEFLTPAGKGTFSVRGWARRERLELRDAPSPTGVLLGPTRTKDLVVAVGGSLGWTGRAGPSSADFRIDGAAERFAPGSWVGAATPPQARRYAVGAGLDYDLRPSDRLTLHGSLRGDKWSDLGGDDGGVNGNRSRDELRITGNLGAEYASGRVALAAHVGRLARPPSFLERYGNRGSFIGNPGLLPESAWTTDAGVRASLGSPRSKAEAELEAVAFLTYAEDLIVFVNQGAFGRAKAVNIGSARTGGLETSLSARLWKLDTRASYTLMPTANLSECQSNAPGCDRPPLPGRPLHELFFDAGITVGPVRAGYGLDVTSGTRADVTGAIVVPARVLQAARLRYDASWLPGLRFTAEVRNLFDVRTASYDGAAGPVTAPIGDLYDYPLAGRTFFVSARFTAPRSILPSSLGSLTPISTAPPVVAPSSGDGPTPPAADASMP